VDESLEALLASAQVWRARAKGAAGAEGGAESGARAGRAGAPVGATGLVEGAARVLPTGWPALDAALPDGGWPLGTLVELLLPSHGVGELQLLLPALRALSMRTPGPLRASSGPAGAWLVWIAPPLAPYPPALAQAGLEPACVLLVDAASTQDRLWSMEQALHSRSCGAVLAWLDEVDDRWLRRLKLAAEPTRTLTVLFRPLARRAQASPAALRLALEPHGEALDVQVLKSRAGPRQVEISLDAARPARGPGLQAGGVR
jgi:cell division inhibitor SulA/protein ImuA